VAVVASLAGILVFLVFEVLPLLAPADVEAGRSQAVDWPEPVSAASDPHRTHVAAIDASGVVRIRALGDSKSVAERSLLDADARIVGVGRIDGTSVFTAAATDGRVAFAPVEWRISYAGRDRVVTPRIAEPTRVVLETGGAALQAYTVATEAQRSTIVGALAGGRLSVTRVAVEVNDFTGERNVSTQSFLIQDVPGVEALVLDPEQRLLYAATERELLSLELMRGRAKPPQVVPLESPLTVMALLIGGRGLITGHADGSLAQYFRVPYGEARIELTEIRRFEPLSSAVRQIEVSQRDRSFLARADDGMLGLYQATSGRRYWTQRVAGGAQTASVLALAPKGDAAYAVSARQIQALELDNPHPEASLAVFLGKIWYEDYAEPQYVWQSTGGTDAFEPKLSLVPLLVGTLKGTLYALLLAVPLGILGAIYVSQFMDARLQGVVKPTVEIMASLPSVVLGFVAGLWLAPRLEHMLPGLLAMLLAVPVLSVLAGAAWRELPRAWTHRLPDGSELALQLVVLTAGGWVCVAASPFLEQLLFGGSVSNWLRETTGLVYDQRNALVAGIAMGFAVIPIILSLSDDALSNVPSTLSAASLALGATRWQTVALVILPAASPGIFAAVMIGLGRAVGETMIVLMATGNTPVLDWNAFNGFRTLSANIAVEIPEAPHGGTLYRTLFASALVLFALTFVLNTAAELVRERLRRRLAGI
jgi:phosphate transport system permease protein